MDLIQTTALGSGDDVAIDDRRRELHVRQDEELDIPQPCYVHCSKSTTKEHELQKKVKRNEKTNGSNGEATYNDLEPAADDAYLDAQFHNSTEICDDNSIFQKFWSNCRDCCKDNNCTQALGPPFDQYLALCDEDAPSVVESVVTSTRSPPMPCPRRAPLPTVEMCASCGVRTAELPNVENVVAGGVTPSLLAPRQKRRV